GANVGGVDSLNILDTAETAGQAFTVTETTIGRSGSGTVHYQAVENLTVQAGSGNDTIDVTSLPAGMTTLINGGDGDDTFTVSVTSTSNYQQFTVDGEGGSNQLNVLNVDAVLKARIRLKPTSPTSGQVDVTYSGRGVYPSAIRYQNVTPPDVPMSADENYIQALHHQIYGRDATDAEVTRWLGVLRQSGRLAVVTALETSVEGRTYLINSWSRRFFRRPATLAQMRLGLTLYARGFSEEYVWSRLYGGALAVYRSVAVRNREVRLYFQRFHNRLPTAAELRSWTSSRFDLSRIRMLLEVGNEFYNKGQ
ncbi:MAG: hypothetical protein U0736_20810, partial [Gemmataceae bacterium]